MNHDDHSPDSDALGRRLHREAMTERPRFSEQLHQRILDRVEADRTNIAPPLRLVSRTPVRLAIAAAVVGALTLIGSWMLRSEPPKPQVVELNQTPVNLAAALKPVVINIDGILTARSSPPEIVFHTPSPADQAPARLSAPPGSPEWLLAALNTPKTSAREMVEEVVPPEMRMLVSLVRWER